MYKLFWSIFVLTLYFIKWWRLLITYGLGFAVEFPENAPEN